MGVGRRRAAAAAARRAISSPALRLALRSLSRLSGPCDRIASWCVRCRARGREAETVESGRGRRVDAEPSGSDRRRSQRGKNEQSPPSFAHSLSLSLFHAARRKHRRERWDLKRERKRQRERRVDEHAASTVPARSGEKGRKGKVSKKSRARSKKKTKNSTSSLALAQSFFLFFFRLALAPPRKGELKARSHAHTLNRRVFFLRLLLVSRRRKQKNSKGVG